MLPRADKEATEEIGNSSSSFKGCPRLWQRLDTFTLQHGKGAAAAHIRSNVVLIESPKTPAHTPLTHRNKPTSVGLID